MQSAHATPRPPGENWPSPQAAQTPLATPRPAVQVGPARAATRSIVRALSKHITGPIEVSAEVSMHVHTCGHRLPFCSQKSKRHHNLLKAQQVAGYDTILGDDSLLGSTQALLSPLDTRPPVQSVHTTPGPPGEAWPSAQGVHPLSLTKPWPTRQCGAARELSRQHTAVQPSSTCARALSAVYVRC